MADNDSQVHKKVREIATRTGADIVAVDDSWVTGGPGFGADGVVRHNAPRIALAWDDPTSPYSAGQTRFIIERQFDYPVTVIRTKRLATVDLRDFDVLILPSAYSDYAGVLGEEGAENLRDWVARGGVLIGLGNANEFLADPNIDLISIRREDAFGTEDESGGEEEESATVAGTLLASEEEYRESIRPVSRLAGPGFGRPVESQCD